MQSEHSALGLNTEQALLLREQFGFNEVVLQERWWGWKVIARCEWLLGLPHIQTSGVLSLSLFAPP